MLVSILTAYVHVITKTNRKLFKHSQKIKLELLVLAVKIQPVENPNELLVARLRASLQPHNTQPHSGEFAAWPYSWCELAYII